MQIIPAIDLKDNQCVRLSKGKDSTSKVFNKNPKEQAIYFQDIGCSKLHVVDLDAAFGRPEINLKSIEKIRNSISIPIQIGGGIRTKSNAEKYFDLGINDLIIGSMAVTKPQDVISLSKRHRNKIYVSLDLKKNSIMVKGWKEESKLKLEDILDLYETSMIKGYVVTDIKNDGMLKGLDIPFIKNTVQQVENKKNKKKIIIAGGLTNYDDLKKIKLLELNSIEGIIAGKSFYVGNIDLSEAQKILNTNG